MFSTLIKNERIDFINGPAGKLAMAIARHEENEGNTWGVVCHPHPLFGGTMDNKIVTTLVRMFQHFKLNTIRFNFRGVGQSEGQYDEGRGELDDLFAVLDWVQKNAGAPSLWLGGFSFGAFVAAKATLTIPTDTLVTVAPPVVNFAMDDITPKARRWLLAQGMQDDVVSPQAVIDWAKNRTVVPQILQFPNAGHYFHGELGALRTALEAALA